MKKGIIILILVMHGTIFPQNWVPLEVGNKWQFYETTDYQGYPFIYHNTAIWEAVSDTVINNNTYYKITPYFVDYPLRYDSLESKLYSYSTYSNNERLEMDFNLSNGDSVQPLRHVVAGQDNLFGAQINYKGYFTWAPAAFTNYEEVRFVEDIGKYYIHSEKRVPGTDYYDVYLNLLQTIIFQNDSVKYYSHNHYPEIIFQPDTLTSDSILTINFEVDNVFSRIEIHQGNDTTLFSFVDTVVMESYYSNRDSVVTNTLVGASQITNTIEYELNTMLNLSLLQNGFDYFYRIKAKDKSMMPHYSFSPATGFYHLKFDTVTSVNDEVPIITHYLLFQNYPNPFNSRTLISYVIPERSFVQINVYDVLGNKVADLVNEEKPTGKYYVNFDGKNLASGIYVYQLQTSKVTLSRKMILLR